MEKKYLANKKSCQVTFILPSAIEARSAAVVGEFNDWDVQAAPMLQDSDGLWKAEITLEAGREYQFRYHVNDGEWHNDWDADRYMMHPYGGENSVVVT